MSMDIKMDVVNMFSKITKPELPRPHPRFEGMELRVPSCREVVPKLNSFVDAV